MITITKIAQAKGNFYTVDFSNGERLRVSEDMLVRYRLLKGQEFSEEELEAIKKKSGYDLGLQMVMNYLSYQIHSEKEVWDYLREKDIEAADRKNIIARLKELNLVDDLSYGESYVRTQMRLSDKGPQYLAQQLKQKGLSADDIEHAISLYTLKDQLEIAVKAGEKFVKKMHHKSYREVRQKLQQRLMQKGFSKEVIQEVLIILEEEPDVDAEYDSLVHQADKIWRRHQRLDQAKRNQKIKQNLFQKGFSIDLIQKYLDEKAAEEELNGETE